MLQSTYEGQVRAARPGAGCWRRHQARASDATTANERQRVCVRNKVFALHVGDDLVLKLPPKRVAELIDAGTAVPHVVDGRPMKEWAGLRPATKNHWLDVAKESLEYVRNKR